MYCGRTGHIGISEYLWLFEHASRRIRWNTMVPSKLENATPTIYTTKSRSKNVSDSDLNPDIIDPIDAQEIFDYIRLHMMPSFVGILFHEFQAEHPTCKLELFSIRSDNLKYCCVLDEFYSLMRLISLNIITDICKFDIQWIYIVICNRIASSFNKCVVSGILMTPNILLRLSSWMLSRKNSLWLRKVMTKQLLM